MLQGDHKFNSIGDLQKAIDDGKTTVHSIVEQCLQVIRDLNPEINAVLAVNENALNDAKSLDVSDNASSDPNGRIARISSLKSYAGLASRQKGSSVWHSNSNQGPN
jgi:Asp-tRNA(Asn)/Glu-tRNA(Gln) amidotransferase A subunit family amidase